MHFLITGGAGFIGSHLTDQLLKENHTVTVVDNLIMGQPSYLPKHPNLIFIQKNINECQPQDLPKSIDGIAHLAANSSVNYSWLNPIESNHNNLSSTMTIIQLCYDLKIPRLVFTSSAAIYGNPLEIPITETHPTNPISPYGLHKLMSEKYINFFTQNYPLSSIILRLFNVFGTRQVANYSGVITNFTSAMKQGLPIIIYGDGRQTRDFIYVQDVVTALIKSLTIPLKNNICLTCNIGGGKAVSLLEIVEILKTYFTQWKQEIKFDHPRLGDIQHSWANINKAEQILGFTPSKTLESNLLHYLQEME